MKLKPFDLEAAKAGAPVVTRDGHKARIICFDTNDDDYPLVVLVAYDEGEMPESYTIKGQYLLDSDHRLDLFMAPAMRRGWVNLYRGKRGAYSSGRIYPTKDKAEGEACSDNYITTVSIEWAG